MPSKRRPKRRNVIRGKEHRNRRHDDRPVSTNQKLAFGTAGGAILIGMCAFAWQMKEILENHTEWAFVKQPPGASEIFRATFFALIAFGGALFADFRKMLSLFINKGAR